VLYWIAGSVSVLFAVCVALIELFRDGRVKLKSFYWLLLPVFALFISWLAVRYSFSGDLRMSLLPDMYYQPLSKPKLLTYIPWILLIIWITIAPLYGKIKVLRKTNYLLAGIQTLLIILLIWKGIEKYGDRNFYEIKKMDYFARKGQWNRIIDESRDGNIHNFLLLNYVNLALAQKGCLCSNMFNFPQNGIEGLIISSKRELLLTPFLSDINFCVGNIALSQKFAFEGNEGCSGLGSGRLLKRLVQTNLIYGEYAIADKYIRTLEHTFFYHKWAVDQRRFLYNDSLCMKDPVLSEKSKYLPAQGGRDFAINFLQTIKRLTEINPSNRAAQEYLLASYLLLRDLDSFSDLLYEYDKKGMITAPLPFIFQQALLIEYELHPEKSKIKGITVKAARLLKSYKLLYRNNCKSNNIKEIMRKQFGSTYLFYFMKS